MASEGDILDNIMSFLGTTLYLSQNGLLKPLRL